ncbi:hypothetical protein GmRootV118_13210 [Variovorax sp. V118]
MSGGFFFVRPVEARFLMRKSFRELWAKSQGHVPRGLHHPIHQGVPVLARVICARVALVKALTPMRIADSLMVNNGE